MLVTAREILQDAHKKGYAVGAFNISNMEILQGIMMAAEAEKAPVILQTSEGAIKYAGLEYLVAMVKAAAAKTSVPVALHLDHGTTYETIIRCIANGWTSVMIDGSHHPLAENIEVTKSIVKIAHAAGVSVEAELGRLSGVEDQISVDERDAIYTNPQEAKQLVDETEVDALAIAIGTAHGKYKGEPKLDFERLTAIKKLIDMPVVLHGASGVPEEALVKAISLGVNKINIDTDLRQAYADGMRDVFAAKPDVYDTRTIMIPAREKVAEVTAAKIRIFGSNGKA